MTDCIRGTPAESTTRSLSNRSGSITRLSERDVARPSLIPTERPFSETSDRELLLMCMCAGMGGMITSPDMVYLGLCNAADMYAAHGGDKEKFMEFARDFMEKLRPIRARNNPFAW